MKAEITPGKLSGKIDAVSSKSYLHRMLLCAAFSEKDTVIYLNCRSKDIDATIRCIKAMGAGVEVTEKSLIVHPADKSPDQIPVLDCGESGSTARFVLPMTAAACGGGTLIGQGRLPERPFGAICRVMEENGCRFSSHSLPMTVRGELKAGIYRIPANISSQYISALMMSLPLADGDSEIVFTTEVESAGYLDITESVMKDFGMPVMRTGNGYRIAGNRRYHSPGEIEAEGDWSNGAFWEAANALGCAIETGNLNPDSLQRDRRIVDVARRLFPERIEVKKESGMPGNGKMTGSEAVLSAREMIINGADIPDIIPVSAIMACARTGRTRFTDCGRLRLKESDRLMSVACTINALGGRAAVDNDDLIIDGCGYLAGGTADSFGDHRIVMSAAVAAVISEGPVIITGAEDVCKSYPDFFRDYASLGGKVRVF